MQTRRTFLVPGRFRECPMYSYHTAILDKVEVRARCKSEGDATPEVVPSESSWTRACSPSMSSPRIRTSRLYSSTTRQPSEAQVRLSRDSEANSEISLGERCAAMVAPIEPMARAKLSEPSDSEKCSGWSEPSFMSCRAASWRSSKKR